MSLCPRKLGLRGGQSGPDKDPTTCMWDDDSLKHSGSGTGSQTQQIQSYAPDPAQSVGVRALGMRVTHLMKQKRGTL